MMQSREMRVTHTLKKAVYRKTTKLLKEGWQKKGEMRKISISNKLSVAKYFIYTQDFRRKY